MIFRNLASKWELSFFNSMEKLHVERPTTLTRVSEYIPEIVLFVEEIVKKGLAYEGGGSIWFDTAKFDGAEMMKGGGGGGGENNEYGIECWKHNYAKLQPWSKGNRELLEDGEGLFPFLSFHFLSLSFFFRPTNSISSLLSSLLSSSLLSIKTGALSDISGQRAPSDFGLWKASKPGEPAWDSPWGPGRPGWHIECSVMATAILGNGMDVHSGGVDLAFPHHDNEIAQSEVKSFLSSFLFFSLLSPFFFGEGTFFILMLFSVSLSLSLDKILDRHIMDVNNGLIIFFILDIYI